MCDMLSGSVERIVSSSWLLLFLERVRILKWIVQRRQKSYHVHTQVSSTYNKYWHTYICYAQLKLNIVVPCNLSIILSVGLQVYNNPLKFQRDYIFTS